MKVQSILATKGAKVFSIAPERSIREATQMLTDRRVGALVVLNDAGALVGIVSERDIVRAVAQGMDLQQPVSTLMTRNVVVGSLHDDLSSVMQTMTEKRFRHLPVVEQGELVGMISIGDLIKAQLAQYQGEIETLVTQITQGE